ncbi:hypothetical protein EVAR_4409_1 [Eumeta japonica]|uniref:Uncharacterized protein n=1 Tax=Eumeta variegata TaxID=151549 RepID=A0A4C1T138_EUMVA|nr:hypothetical protein EVAR_4409_1 [Eumeta japonica]
MVTAAHERPQFEKSHLCVAGLLNGNTKPHRSGRRLLMKPTVVERQPSVGLSGISGERNDDENRQQG